MQRMQLSLSSAAFLELFSFRVFRVFRGDLKRTLIVHAEGGGFVGDVAWARGLGDFATFFDGVEEAPELLLAGIAQGTLELATADRGGVGFIETALIEGFLQYVACPDTRLLGMA